MGILFDLYIDAICNHILVSMRLHVVILVRISVVADSPMNKILISQYRREWFERRKVNIFNIAA